MATSNPSTLIQAAADTAEITLAGSAEVSIHAHVEGAAPKRPSFTSQAYTGGELRVAGFPKPVVIDLAGLRASETVSVLFDHDYKQIVGQATEATIQAGAGGGVHIAGIITGDDGAAATVVSHAKNGFKWPVSVGVSARQVQFVEEGKQVQVNGRTFTGPVYVARSGVLREMSFTGVGADEHATAQVAASAAGEHAMTFEQWLEAHEFEPAKVTGKQRETLQKQFDAELNASAAPEASPALAPATVEARIAAERVQLVAEVNRIAAIRKVTLDLPEIQAKAIAEGWTPDKAELEATRTRRPHPPSTITAHSFPADIQASQVIEAALCLSLNMPDAVVARGLDARAVELAHGPRFRRYGLQRLMFECIQANGGHATVGQVDNDMIRAALVTDPSFADGRGMITAADGFSTLSFTGILSNVANKAMLAAYNAVATIVPLIAFETDTNDFKPFKRYRLTGQGTFQEVGASGELTTGELTDEEYTNQLKTFGRIITLTRQHVINDDLNAFTDIPRILGREAALAREEKVMTLWLTGVSSGFFASGNGNYLSGAGSALGIPGLTASTKAFREQKDIAGKPILIAPRSVVVPPALEALAMQLYRDTTVITIGMGTSAAVTPNSNPWSGSFKPINATYQGTAFGIPGSSDTAWAMIADPVDTAAVQVGYLRGQRVPIIETAAADFATLGVKYRGYWDFGVAFLDKRAAVWNAGV